MRAERAAWDRMATVGRIARTFGLCGEVIVNLETDFPHERFRPGAELFVERGGLVEPVTLTTVRFPIGRPVIGIAGVGTIDQARALAGRELRVPPEALVALPEGTFYWHDLVGCHVETPGGGAVGVVKAVEGTMTGSQLVVQGSSGDVLIPVASEICRTIDVAAKRIVIEPPEGLLDLNV